MNLQFHPFKLSFSYHKEAGLGTLIWQGTKGIAWRRICPWKPQLLLDVTPHKRLNLGRKLGLWAIYLVDPKCEGTYREPKNTFLESQVYRDAVREYSRFQNIILSEGINLKNKRMTSDEYSHTFLASK